MLDTVINLPAVILGFGALIFFHELGHFVAAKWAGVRTGAFAVGMGPVLLSWRRGIGLVAGSTQARVVEMTGSPADKLTDEELAHHGLGETEYSLRLLPLGGFVSMLGQEDGKPEAVSDDPRSYNLAPVGKRMVIISAGVVMNLILAIVLFVIAFGIGVKFEAPVIGSTQLGGPATRAGLLPGDTITKVNGASVSTFKDVDVSAAMAKPDEALLLEWTRDGQVLEASVLPEVGPRGLLSLGILPAASATLRSDLDDVMSQKLWSAAGLASVPGGSVLTHLDGEPVTSFSQAAERGVSTRAPRLRFSTPEGGVVEVPVGTTSVLPVLDQESAERGWAGLSPVPQIDSIADGAPSEGLLEPGDRFAELEGVAWPSIAEIQSLIANSTNPKATIQRGDAILELDLVLRSDGKLGIGLSPATGPLQLTGPRVGEEFGLPRGLALPGGLDFVEFAQSISDLPEPKIVIDGNTYSINLTQEDREAAKSLKRTLALSPSFFEPESVTLQGSIPFEAASMGTKETVKWITLTYLTIDRLVRGSVEVKQLHGPVGILDVGAKTAAQGFTYLLFFLGLLSVNLAVLNFLPLPVVDGGHMIFLAWEGVTGRPPSVTFQKWATMLGLGLLGSLFVVTFFNDLSRLFG